MDPHRLAWVGLEKVTTDGRNFLRPTPSPQEAMEMAIHEAKTKDSEVESMVAGRHSAVLI
jgi:hypothetical protein